MKQLSVWMLLLGLLCGSAIGQARYRPPEQRIADLERQVAILTDKLANVTKQGDELVISGVNLRICNGWGKTGLTNGVGNLVLGYNELSDSYPQRQRTGSHNLVIGPYNGYLGSAGLVVGSYQVIGDSACVLGGRVNTAWGSGSVVVGGSYNGAWGARTLVAGGTFNNAEGADSALVGGEHSTLRGPLLTLVGGSYVTLPREE